MQLLLAADHRVTAQHTDLAIVHAEPIRQHLCIVLAKQRRCLDRRRLAGAPANRSLCNRRPVDAS